MADERFTRFARWIVGRHKMPIVSGDPPEPLAVEWVALSRILEAGAQDPNWCLYLLTSRGRIVECLQWDTERIALDQAHAILGIEQDEWRDCDAALSDSKHVDLRIFTDRDRAS